MIGRSVCFPGGTGAGKRYFVEGDLISNMLNMVFCRMLSERKNTIQSRTAQTCASNAKTKGVLAFAIGRGREVQVRLSNRSQTPWK